MKKAELLFLFADTDEFQSKTSLEKLMQELPIEIQQKALRYRHAQSAFAYVLGRKLLQEGLEKLGIDKEKITEITYNDHQKPELKEVFFNISHSENVVVCALTQDCSIGVDIELKEPRYFDNFSSFFSKKEWNFIQNGNNQLQNFHFLWRRKESIIKAKGRGLGDLNKFSESLFEALFFARNDVWKRMGSSDL